MDKFELISELMGILEGEMEPSEHDLGERLGRPKVEVAIESEEPMLDDDMAMPMEGDMESPEDKFKQRIMKLRG